MLLPQVSQTRPSKRVRALSPEQVVELRHAYADGIPTSLLAQRYGVSKNTAHRVAVGEIYTDVVTPPRIPLVEPTVRYRGYHSEDECRQIGAMLRHHVGTWVLVKKNNTRPDASRYASFGMETSVIQVNHPDGKYGLYVRWAPATMAIPVVTAKAG